MTKPRVRMTHEGFLLRYPERGVHVLTERVTADEDLFLVTHMGLAEVDAATWRLSVGGLVSHPTVFNLEELAALPQHEVASVHECAGSPLTPKEPKRRVGNVVWRGPRLADVLDAVKPMLEASFIWTEGLEWGEFAGMTEEPFVKDLPILKATRPEVLLALSMNGTPLSPERGGPVRLVVPGWYGTNSVKWVGRVTLADRRAPGPYTTRFYNDPTPEGPRPVWGVAPGSVIVSPSPDRPPRAGETGRISGWAWAENGVARVEVSVDGGGTWRLAAVDPHRGFQWQGFSLDLRLRRGQHQLRCRCFDHSGVGQPESGARNAVHEVVVVVA